MGRLRDWLARREPLLWHFWTALVICGVAAAFYVPGLSRTGGSWPVPLDDVYIYFNFARSWALGHPFEWIPGNGYSSGCTAVLYPVLLAPGYALGLRGTALGGFAAALAVGLLFDLCRSLRALVKHHGASWWFAPLVMAIPLLDYAWLSGMETALLGAVLGRCLLSAQRAWQAPPHRRGTKQLVAGLWLALLVLTRPEAITLALPLGAAIVYGARSLSTAASAARAFGPWVAALGTQALVNRFLTGEWASAGAVRKLIWSAPFMDEKAGALEFLKNLIVVHNQALDRALGPGLWGMALPSLALLGIALRRNRQLALVLVLASGGYLALVCSNHAARFQNLRYATPVLAMLVLGGIVGLAAMLRRRRWRLVGAALALVAIVAPLGQFPRQTAHFAQASANILAQQGEVARRLARRQPLPRRVFINDAGLIPYLSGLHALDGLGLGGFQRLPFARASLNGPPAVIELIERLPPEQRPDVLAVYTKWWPGLVDVFGRKIDEVAITDNVVCGSEVKTIYRADWSSLGPAPSSSSGSSSVQVLDELDVADLVAERAHDYEYPKPEGGWTVGEQYRLASHGDFPIEHGPAGSLRWDAGRFIPPGRAESFRVVRAVPTTGANLVVRTDAATNAAVRVELWRGDRLLDQQTPTTGARQVGYWGQLTVRLQQVARGDRIRLVALDQGWRSFHIWLIAH